MRSEMSETRDWKPISTAPERKEVWTKIDDAQGERNVAHLKRIGRLWFFPDGSMYVYYAPTHWAELEAGIRDSLPAQKGQGDALQALSERAEETPLCANHAQIWYTMRNTLKPKSGCVACDAESGFTRLRTCIQKLKELPREDVEQVILDHHGVGRHYKWKTPFVRADALDAILKECAL